MAQGSKAQQMILRLTKKEQRKKQVLTQLWFYELFV